MANAASGSAEIVAAGFEVEAQGTVVIVAVAEQVVEQIEHPGLDSDDNVAAAQLAPRQIELTVSERVLHVTTRPSTPSNQRNPKE